MTSNIPQGFLGLPDLSTIVDQVTKVLPPQVSEAIKDTVGKLVDPDNDEINIGDPQPEGTPPIPVEAGSEELSTAVKAIDAVLGALGLIEKFNFIVPDQYEGPLKSLAGALKTVRGWLD